MIEVDPRTLKDARINDVIVESPARICLHLKDGRAVALKAEPALDDFGDESARIIAEHVNPGGAA